MKIRLEQVGVSGSVLPMQTQTHEPDTMSLDVRQFVFQYDVGAKDENDAHSQQSSIDPPFIVKGLNPTPA